MKRISVTFLLVFAMLAMFVGTVGAAPQLGVKFLGGVWTGGPVIFSFEVDQDLTGDGWITGSVVWGNGKVEMTCNQEENIVKCSAPKSVAGQPITVFFQGFAFQTFVQPLAFCYGIYDWALDGSATWVNYGEHCQDSAPNYGDAIEWYNPAYDGIYPYEFLPESPNDLGCMLAPMSGDAFYFPWCLAF